MLSAAGQATDLFGRVRDDGLAGILRNLEQTWDGAPLYPNVETRAANLLYLVIKDRPFFDGNKRIGSLLFLHYLGKNSRPLAEENALVALALLIAESDPKSSGWSSACYRMAPLQASPAAVINPRRDHLHHRRNTPGSSFRPLELSGRACK